MSVYMFHPPPSLRHVAEVEGRGGGYRKWHRGLGCPKGVRKGSVEYGIVRLEYEFLSDLSPSPPLPPPLQDEGGLSHVIPQSLGGISKTYRGVSVLRGWGYREGWKYQVKSQYSSVTNKTA